MRNIGAKSIFHIDFLFLFLVSCVHALVNVTEIERMKVAEKKNAKRLRKKGETCAHNLFLIFRRELLIAAENVG